MATIPIEVIVQDADTPVDPTPTPETNNTETNITVPDTGAETLGNNTFSSSSAASIILPIVLLVVSLATICTLLIHRHHKRQDSKVSKKEKLSMYASATIAVLAATLLVGDLILPVTKAATSDTEVSIEVPDKISIVVSREDDITEATTEATAYITSTSAFGYEVLLSMAEGVATSNLYLNGDNTSEYYIAPVENEALSTNTWGYTLADEETYSAVPLLDTPATIAQGNEPVENEELIIYYGINIDKSLPEGTYTSNIEYIITAQEPTLPITYMQDFATLSEEDKAALISSMPEGYQFILKDSRDQKDYYISKLADGNVWMTQNLDFDIINNGADLNYINTDVPVDWTDAGNLVNTRNDAAWNGFDNTPESYDPGILYWNGAMVYDQESCNANGGEWYTWGGGICVGYSVVSSSGNSHYRLGNYYNWTAAVAMSDSSSYTTDGVDINQSICPAGWRLPIYSGDKSFDDLTNQAHFAAGIDGNMHVEPNYFVYNGNHLDNNIDSLGISGWYWSSATGRNSGLSYSFSFDAKGGNVNPQQNDGRYRGNAVRCVAR